MAGLPDYIIISLTEWARLRAIYKRAKLLKQGPSVELDPECRDILCQMVTDFGAVMSEIMIQPAVKKAMAEEGISGDPGTDNKQTDQG